MATPTIPNGETQFFPIIYEGNGAGQRVGRFVPFTDNGTIANSCIFDHVTNAYVSRTPSSNGSGTTLTFSCWIKRDASSIGSATYIMFTNDFSANGEVLQFDSSNRLYYYKVQSGWSYISNRTFEDTSKFYHILISRDTNDSTAGDRVKIYVDGDRITSFSSSSDPSSGATGYWNQTTLANVVGNSGNGSYVDGAGYLAEVNMIDGQALLPASFGLTDTSTGRWVPSVVKPYPTTTTTFTVTVADASGNKYFIDSSQQATVTLIEGATYRFDQSDSSNAGHPLRFSTTSNGTHSSGVEFTSGVTTAGTPGSSGAYTEITVPVGTATLYYYCTNHSGMGGTANTQDQYGVNGFRLKFQDSSSLGDDTSGNTNDLTATNLASTDQTTDSPTQNHMTFGGRTGSSITLSEGNLKVSVGAADTKCITGMGIPTSGKYYWEVTLTTLSTYGRIGVAPADANFGVPPTSDGIAYDRPETAGGMRVLGTDIGSGWDGAFTEGNIMNFALDADNKFLYIGENNTWRNSGDPTSGATGTGGVPYGGTSLQDKILYPSVGSGAAGGTKVYDFNFGQRSLSYTPPTDYVTLQQDNLPEAVKGVSGLVWTKNRDATDSHQLYDSSRGKQKVILPDATTAESTVTDGLQKFLAGGQQIEDNVAINTSGESFVSWNWVANSGTTSSNTDGSITSTVQANTTAGFSIIQHTGTGSAGATYGHGLSQAPTWVITKNRDASTDWMVWHHKLTSAGYFLDLNNTEAQFSSAYFNSTAPSSSVITCGTSAINNGSGNTHITYAWHEVEGFSKFGKYTGNGNADGTFVYTGFLPAWIMVKSLTTNYWMIQDTARWNFNPTQKPLFASSTDAESGLGLQAVDILSNGFKLRSTESTSNASGQGFIYMAFAEHPFVGDGTSPVTAR